MPDTAPCNNTGLFTADGCLEVWYPLVQHVAGHERRLSNAVISDQQDLEHGLAHFLYDRGRVEPLLDCLCQRSAKRVKWSTLRDARIQNGKYPSIVVDLLVGVAGCSASAFLVGFKCTTDYRCGSG